jgi:hypothetical protein
MGMRKAIELSENSIHDDDDDDDDENKERNQIE